MLFIIGILIIVIRLRNCLQTILIKTIPVTVLKFAGTGWGREGVSRERGGDGEKNYNTGWEWERFFKCGVGTKTNFGPHVIL